MTSHPKKRAAPPDIPQDEVLFDIFGQYVLGDLEIPGLTPQLDELQLPKTRRKNWSDWILTCGEEYDDAIKGNGQLPTLDGRPEVEDPDVSVWWDELAADFTRETWSQLLDRTHSSQKSNASRQQSQQKQNTAAGASRSSQPGPSSKKDNVAIPRRPSARPLSSGSKAANDEDNEGFFDRRSSAPVHRSKRRRSTPTYLNDFDMSEEDTPRKPRDNQEDTPRQPKGKGKQKSTSQARSASASVRGKSKSLKAPSKTSALERHELRAARAGRAAESSNSDATMSDAEAVGNPDPSDQNNTDDEVDAAIQSQSDVNPPRKSKAGTTAAEGISVEDIDDLAEDEAEKQKPATGLGSRGSKYPAYFRPRPMGSEWRVDKKTKARYRATVQYFECRCCNNPVKVTDKKISALALHFNPDSTSYCKYKFTLKDKGMLGVFDDDKDAPCRASVPHHRTHRRVPKSRRSYRSQSRKVTDDDRGCMQTH
ncbi:hypothetical protein CF327_g1193 [Tilletia walkeri]|nr:hypothetical protein CF327_g1193 [Tilletia walkeri]